MYRLDALRDALLRLDRSKRFVTFRQLVASPASTGVVVVRFDVERDLRHHLQLAIDLADHGIAASLYFHTRRACFDPHVLMAIQDAGHEVGYHHECLDRCAGDKKRARDLFLREVDLFRRHGLDVSTCCSHGEPGLRKTGYKSNWDLFDAYPNLLEEAGLEAEMYLWLRERNEQDLAYATDTFSGYGRFFSTIERATGAAAPMMVLVHPHRWRHALLATAIEVGRDLGQHGRNRLLRRRSYDVAPSQP